MTANPLVELAGDLRRAMTRIGYEPDTLLEVLGGPAHAALGRSEPVPARRAARAAGAVGVPIRLFLLGDARPERDVAAALAPLDVDRAVRAGLLERSGTEIRAGLDLRPLDTGSGTRWILSDLDDQVRPRALERDHVLGVGEASLSLLRASPTEPVDTVLDLGTGCGVQAVHAAAHARRVTGTDVNPRALMLATATAALNETDLELLAGSWFDPVAGRRFDRVVANPPFVVGPGSVEHTYRDSGLALDGASALVVGTAPSVLAPDGTAALLASWLHVAGADWRQRVAGWLPAEGVDAWVVQRDVADPALYVGTWLRDAGYDPRDPNNQRRAEAWLDAFAAADVDGVGFGFVYLRAIDGPTEVLTEELRHEFTDPLGAEVAGYFDRSRWLRSATDDIFAASRFALAPDAVLERVYRPGNEGWAEAVTRLHRGSGPRWQHEIDETLAALVAGMRPDGLTLHELLELLAVAQTGTSPTAGFVADAVDVVRALTRHGLVLPG
ncbi:MAG TPA: methyltransferase [Aldersonia sp.]